MNAYARLSLAFLLFGTLAAVGQQTGSRSQTTRATEPPASKTIRLTVTVTPSSGAPVSGLPQKDFTVLDNGTPQPITSFRVMNGHQEPLEVILVIDNVNTPYAAVARERVYLDKFLRANAGHLQYPTALAISNDKGIQLQRGFTSDGNALTPVVDKYLIGLRSISRNMGIYGAIQRFQLSIDNFQHLVAYAASRPGRKLILWISPGWPLLDQPGLSMNTDPKPVFAQIVSISNALRESDITVYNVNAWGPYENLARTYLYENFLDGVKKPGSARVANLALQVIATQSGGLVLSSRDISGLLQRCVEDANAYYHVSFQPPTSDPKGVVYHRLQVKVAQPGLTARSSTGYYSQP